jgi:ATP-dependent DNA helicase RecG
MSLGSPGSVPRLLPGFGGYAAVANLLRPSRISCRGRRSPGGNSGKKAQKLIEGRRPNLIVSAVVAAATETVVDYLKKRGIDKAYGQKMVVELLEKQGQASRRDFDKLLLGKLSDALDDDQKKNFITNLLQEMRRDGSIRPVAGKRGKGARWEFCNSAPKNPV